LSPVGSGNPPEEKLAGLLDYYLHVWITFYSAFRIAGGKLLNIKKPPLIKVRVFPFVNQ
jgi:hypothetical protein